MTDATVLNSAGLAVDIVGAALLFFFSTPFADLFPADGDGMYLSVKNEKREKKYRCHNRLSRCGMILLGIGFAMQLWSNFLS
jgi:hypothetical protein